MKEISKSIIEITKLLSDLNFHDGDTLGKKINITRSAVWKIIKKLEEYDIKITSIKNKGYKLEEPLLLIDQQHIERELNNQKFKLEIFETITSTSFYLKQNFNPEKFHICIAETQTNGKGRMQRPWHSPFGQNLYISIAYNFKKDVSELNGLSLVVGIAIIYALKEININEKIKLKWPNDGVFDGKKLFGILIDLISESYSTTTAIIGIGINANMIEDNEKITQQWTSLKKITGNYIDRNKLVISLIHNLDYLLKDFEQFGLRHFINQWFELDALINKEIELTIDNIKGTAKGINEFGHLVLELKNGNQMSFSSGEASIIKK